MRKAIINTDTGLVENIIEADETFDPGPGKQLLDDAGAQIGGSWDGTQFVAPPEPPAPLPTREEFLADTLDSAPNDATRWVALAAYLRSAP